MRTLISAAAMAAAAFSTFAAADNLERLSGFKTTGEAMMEPIPQEGRRADSIRRIPEDINVPEGFEISLYALLYAQVCN